MVVVGTFAAPWRGSLFCCGREKKYEHASCLPGLAQVFFNLPDQKDETFTWSLFWNSFGKGSILEKASTARLKC